MKRIFLLLFFFSFSSLFAQKQGQERIDSLLKVIPSMPDDTNKVKALSDISSTYWSINPDEGIKYGKQALELAGKFEWKQGMATAYGRIGVNYGAISNNQQALEFHFKALKINEELNNKKAIAGNLNNIGNVYMKQTDYPKSLDYYRRALKINQEIGNTNWAGRNLGNIGNIYWHLKKLDEAKENYLLAIEALQNSNDKNLLALNYSNLGNVYFDKHEYSDALDCYVKGLNMHRERGDKVLEAGALGNIGGTYQAIADDSNTTYLKKMVGGNKKLALQKAKLYLDSALVLDNELGLLDNQINDHIRMSDVAEQMGDNKEALKYFRTASILKDSLFNLEKSKKLTETAMEFEFSKKEAAAKAEQEKKDLQERNIRYFILFGFAAALLFAIVVFRQRNRLKKEKKEVEKQRLLLHQKNREVTESIIYAERIQRSLLTTEKYIEKTLRRLRGK